MAEKRMFAKTIIESDAFLDMPMSSQLLYFHLSMRADDDGFINQPKNIMRMVGAKDDDIKMLIGKKFVIPFESGIVVIKHWKIHNYIQNDRYNETKYKNEKAQLILDENKAYKLQVSECIQDVHTMDTQIRLDKIRLDKVSIDKSVNKFTAPTLDDVSSYCLERKNTVNPQKFIDHYSSNGWMVGRTKMKDWKAAVRTWESNNYDKVDKSKVVELPQYYDRNDIDEGVDKAELLRKLKEV